MDAHKTARAIARTTTARKAKTTIVKAVDSGDCWKGCCGEALSAAWGGVGRGGVWLACWRICRRSGLGRGHLVDNAQLADAQALTQQQVNTQSLQGHSLAQLVHATRPRNELLDAHFSPIRSARDNRRSRKRKKAESLESKIARKSRRR